MPAAASGAGKQKKKLVLDGVTVAVAGNLGPGWTDTDVARWLGYNGGRFAASVTDDVTHLLCTAEEYAKPKKKQDAAVREALRRGPKKVHIVLRDWLEDSLHRHSRRRERAYLLRHIHRSSQHYQKEKQERQERLLAKGRQLGETFVDTGRCLGVWVFGCFVCFACFSFFSFFSLFIPFSFFLLLFFYLQKQL